MDRHVWTLKEVEYLKKAYKSKTVRQIAKEMNLQPGQVDAALNRYKISSGRDGRFKKGIEVWNKGKNFSCSPDTQFKKGSTPANTKFDGAISLRRDNGTGVFYKYIRVSCGKWKLLHRYLWEQVHGPIPKNMLLVFKDKNPDNCDLSNLQLMTPKENLIRNHNREKAAKKLGELWRIERVRQVYGLPAKTGLGRRINKAA